MRYIDFVDLNYSPSETDLICEFFVQPKDFPLMEAMGGIAAESSIGTWTELKTIKTYVKQLRARVFEIKGNLSNIKLIGKYFAILVHKSSCKENESFFLFEILYEFFVYIVFKAICVVD